VRGNEEEVALLRLWVKTVGIESILLKTLARVKSYGIKVGDRCRPTVRGKRFGPNTNKVRIERLWLGVSQDEMRVHGWFRSYSAYNRERLPETY
jgi:hypothetical protein